MMKYVNNRHVIYSDAVADVAFFTTDVKFKVGGSAGKSLAVSIILAYRLVGKSAPWCRRRYRPHSNKACGKDTWVGG